MTSDPGYQRDPTLDDYFDGLLDEESRRRFEEKLEQDPGLRAQMERQNVLNDALNRMCVPTAGSQERVFEAVRQAGTTAKASVTQSGAMPFYRRRWAIAALLALSMVAAWRLAGVIEQRRSAGDGYGPKPWTSMATYYRQVESDFKPEWVCKDDAEFANAFKKRLRQPALVAATTGPIVGLGLGYANCLSPRTMTYLALVQDQPVVVFVDKLKNDSHPELPLDSGLHLFRKELDQLILYEVSPLTEPHVLELFYVPER